MTNYTKKQEKQIKKFKKNHNKCRDKKGFSYCQFTYEETPTGIGSIDKIKCNYCGEILDITDVESW